MARVHFVKKALKDNPVCKAGESYFWWKPMVGGRGGAKRYSKERPTRAQLTQSEFLGQAYDLADAGIPGACNAEDLREIASQIRDLGQEQQDKLDNMPDSLQQGDTGQMIQERIDGCDEWATEVDSQADDLPDEPEDNDDPDEDDPERTAREVWLEKLEEAKQAAADACPF